MPATRTITGPLTNADGSLFSGSLEISWASGVIGSETIVAGRRSVPVVAGVLSVGLAAYTFAVRYSSGVFRTWVVPAGSGSLTVSQVEQ